MMEVLPTPLSPRTRTLNRYSRISDGYASCIGFFPLCVYIDVSVLGARAGLQERKEEGGRARALGFLNWRCCQCWNVVVGRGCCERRGGDGRMSMNLECLGWG